MLKVGSDFSGVGAFNQALMRLGVDYKEIFACDMDKYARQTFIQNYGEPEYFPENVYDREIPSESLDIYMTSPPCQAFSTAGKRLGKEDARGILFFNSHEFIQKNKPRFFIFENVKGLLSHDKTNKKDKIGNTFREWLDYLGGKSVNGVANMYPIEDAVPYHIHWKVLNAKKHGVPQNRERVFIIGIRDDQDNTFVWPEEEDLSKRLKDVLEKSVDEKYFLSEKVMSKIIIENLKVKSATKKGYEQASVGDSINFSVPNSETRRGRVGKGVAQTLDTACNQGVMILDCYNNNLRKDNCCGTITQHCSREGMTNGFKVIENYKIRRLTPRECFRLMDFPDSFTWPVSDSQAYKQAGNSIVVNVLYKILKQLPL
jgi:DNA (cytosine-5)-methyltransferase 1